MYKNRKILLFAFASLDLNRSANRLKKQAELSNYYDEIKILNPIDFDEKMKRKFDNIVQRRKNRGYGYWFWKPLFIKKIMEQLNPGDIIHYVDIGCHIQNKNFKFNNYLDLLIDNDGGFCLFNIILKRSSK